jgi:arylsulfatase A-like enzyme
MVARIFAWRSIFCLLAVCALVVAGTHPDASAAPEPAGGSVSARLPNILVIVTDDQRAGTLDVMPKTRHFFQRYGTKFPNVFVSTPLCCPARASIFSGRYVHNHGILRSGTDPSVFDQEATMQARLQNAGYWTAIAGKFINSWNPLVDPPYFDRWASFSRGAQFGSDGYYDLTFNVDGTQTLARNYSTHFIRNRAFEFLQWFEQDDARPWFLYVAPFAPHPPAIPEPKYERARIERWQPSPSAFEEDLGDKPLYVQLSRKRPRRVARLRADQLRTLMSVDDMVGRLFARLDRLGEKQNTLAIFLSDNGFMWGEHNQSGKSVPYTESTQIPMLIRWPGHVRRGATDRRFASNVDVAPTALDAADLSAEAMDGRSLIDRTWRRDRVLLEFWAGKRIPRWASIRTKEYQYTEYYSDDPEGEVVADREFYDLRADPWQLENLVADEDPTNDPLEWMPELLSADRVCVAILCP